MNVVIWLLSVEALGLLVAPAVWALFEERPSSGVVYAKAFGLLLVGLVSWLAVVLRILPYTRYLLLGVSGFIGVLVWYVWGAPFARWIWRLSSRKVLVLIGLEALFIVAFLFRVLLTRLNANAYLSEKPMNMAFVNAINRSHWFPPHDPWLAGFSVNYYYFGHFLVAVLIRLSGVSPWIGFSLAGCTFFAYVASTIFGGVVDIIDLQQKAEVKSKRRARWAILSMAGLGAVLMALFTGNLVPMRRVIEDPGIVRFWWANGEPNWWRAPYHAAGHGGLTELPWRTYMLSYLHSFDIALPFLLLFSIFGLGYWSDRRDQASRFLSKRVVLWALSLSLLGGGACLASPWVLPACALFAVLLFAQDAISVLAGRAGWLSMLGWVGGLGVGLLLILLFARDYQSPDTSVRLDRNAATAIPLETFLLQLGVRLVGIGIVIANRWWSLRSRYLSTSLILAVAMVALFARLTWVGASAAIAVSLCCLLALLIAWEYAKHHKMPVSLIALLIAQVLDTIPFFLTIHDSGNTFYKLGFLAWVLGSMGIFADIGSFVLEREDRPASLQPVVSIALVVALFVGSWMPLLATAAITDRFQGRQPRTLDGVYFYFKNVYPEEYEAVKWLRDHVEGDAVVLEAPGPSFTPAGRVASFTGLSTVLGWRGHEHLWHENEPDVLQEISRRMEDVNKIYSTLDPAEAQRLLDLYGVEYVFVGGVERGEVTRQGRLEPDWSRQALAKFDEFMTPVYSTPESGEERDVIIYVMRGLGD